MRRKIPPAIRRQVAERANYRCNYCRSPEWVGIPMVMEHIVPLVKGGASTPDNLCFSCYRCNEFKGASITAFDPITETHTPLFHPHQQSWHDHFAWSNDGLYIVGLTTCGRAMVTLLQLNSDWILRARRIWIAAGLHPPLEWH